MPVHDWKPVDANLFHDCHQTWAVEIRNALNAGRLPSGYSALVEQHAGGLVPDVLFQTSEDELTARGNRVVIRHRLGEVVCVIEIVSPGNKASRHGLKSFLKKTLEFLDSGVNLLVIDLLPPTPRDPQGIHHAIWEEFTGQSFEPPADKPLTLAAYVAADLPAGTSARAYVEPIGVGDLMPDMPAYLDAAEYVPVPLEATYQAAWATCPEDMRVLVETGRLPDELA
jgi:hypothetical protein